MRARILSYVALLLFAAGAGAQTVAERAARDDTFHMPREEPAMRKAFDRASATLSDFLTKAAKPETGTTDYAIKVAISDKNGTEYFWVANFRKEGARFSGILANEPRIVLKHKAGERITFSRSQIVDWTYFDDVAQRTHGNFTACALLSKEPPDQAAALKKEHGLVCDE
jgi:uncharacterized protein YegJ (DUF2314 family)